MRSEVPGWALLAVVCSCFAGWLAVTTPAAQAVTIDWVEVGNPGNTADDGGLGAVAGTYLIGKYEITNAQYTEFLNAVAAVRDRKGLYKADMGSVLDYGGITRSGSYGNYTYSTIAGRENMPVNHVTFYDALRFANWLHNGQPSGEQDSMTTEDGAYTITARGIDENTITRNTGATIFLPTEDEWYKAAFFNGTSYFVYPVGTDTQTECVLPSGDTGNSANCDLAVGDLTSVGAYSLSAGPYGTFDQGGNVEEWTETIVAQARFYRAGSFADDMDWPPARTRALGTPSRGSYDRGFRVAMIPEPSTALLLGVGLAGLAVRRRLSA